MRRIKLVRIRKAKGSSTVVANLPRRGPGSMRGPGPPTLWRGGVTGHRG